MAVNALIGQTWDVHQRSRKGSASIHPNDNSPVPYSHPLFEKWSIFTPAWVYIVDEYNYVSISVLFVVILYKFQVLTFYSSILEEQITDWYCKSYCFWHLNEIRIINYIYIKYKK